MNDRIKPSGGSLLDRWSRLKREAREKERSPADHAAAALAGTSAADAAARAVPASTAQPTTQPNPEPTGAADATLRGAPGGAPDTLPPVESLTIDSDFSAFLQPKVDEALRRQALKQLFRDPRFNVMDGLDTYVGDYTQPDPIAPEIVREMVQGRYIFDPPPTRVNAQGVVEDVPAEELAAEKLAAAKAPGTPADADAPPDAETSPAAADVPSAPEDNPVVATSTKSANADTETPPSGAPELPDKPAR